MLNCLFKNMVKWLKDAQNMEKALTNMNNGCIIHIFCGMLCDV